MAITQEPRPKIETKLTSETEAKTGAPAHASTTSGSVEVKRFDELRAQFFQTNRATWKTRATSPVAGVVLAILVIVGLLGYGVGAAINGSGASGTSTTPTSSSAAGTMASMGSTSGSTSTSTTNIPNATQNVGGQEAEYTVDPDGAKHFTFTAQQVMWEVVKGHRVLAWTLDGTVPGPMIHVTAGDHVRITINNKLPEATSIHWHGLEVPANQDGVPGTGSPLIQPGQSYTYDFTIKDEDAGTHWYHSHYDDMTQVGGGLFGAFIVDPRPGSPEAQNAIHADVTVTDFVSNMDGYFLISGKAFPDTQPIQVKQGQTVHIRLIGADTTMSHPMHLHGDFFNIMAEDGHTLAQPIQKDTVLVSPGETYDLTFQDNQAPGSVFPFHCHILTHVMNPGQTGDEMGGLIQLVETAKQ